MCLDSLDELSIESMRQRSYDSVLKPLKKIDYRRTQHTYMMAYNSDGQALYSRLDFPASTVPASGFPLVVLAPGWISRKQAVDWDFGLDGKSTYSLVVDSFVEAGYAVVTVGYRGRGTIHGTPAQGMAYRDVWGNGSYVSPLFYAIDTLNLLAGLDSLAKIHWKQWLPTTGAKPKFDLNKVSLWGHSQGGDVGLTVLAVVGKNATFGQYVFAASIWSGNIADRFTQVETFEAMATTTEAFMSGDGTWTGSATGRNGELNPDFVFPWPADWIGTLDTESEDWTWQAEQWSTTSVFEARKRKYREMYNTFNQYVANLGDADFHIFRNDRDKTVVEHPASIAQVIPKLGGFHYANYITAPLSLHISDRDYYSLPVWNQDLAKRVNQAGGKARVYLYPGNTHSLKLSTYDWFSPENAEPGAPLATARDIQLFSSASFGD
ncbi:alpha/beta hydrolase [Kineobactrum sediminis]|uniref:Alpha/beta hydrolase n=1 Tax=Kineobactrum sediminis TaxID=1905677 RepID=A0A2N5XZ94_9GAMM|nr:alpha/beta hydrolase [Kineobactrum sediminis]